MNLTVVAVYAPTVDAAEEVKDSFFDALQDAVDRVPAGGMLIVAGDLNAKPDLVDLATRHILGKFAVGTRCANGDRLVNFAPANRLVVSSTRFQHPQRHLVIWFSNDGRTRTQIDHMLVRSRWASSVINCRAYVGAQTGSEYGSDHAMVRPRLRLRMKVARISNCPAKLDTARLKAVALKRLRLDLRNRFEGLQLNEDASPADEWRELKDAVAGASQAHLGKTRRRRRDWVTGETIALTGQARLARIQSAPNHRFLRRQTTRALRRDCNGYWKAIAEETERVAACGDTRKLYHMLKSASRRPVGVGVT